MARRALGGNVGGARARNLHRVLDLGPEVHGRLAELGRFVAFASPRFLMVDRFSSIPPASLSGMVIQSEVQPGVTYEAVAGNASTICSANVWTLAPR